MAVTRQATEAPRVAIVTGAGRGIGAAIAARLRVDGWSVMASDVTPPSVPSYDSGATYRQCDVSSPDAVAELVDATSSTFGRVDAVVNNAGVGGPSGAVVDSSPVEFMAVLEVNLLGPFLLARAAAPLMIDGRRGGRIVNIGSLFGQQAVAGGAAYCASKAGVAALTQSLALELAPAGITVNTVAPGNMWTAMHAEELAARAARSGRTAEEEREVVRRSIPLGRHGTGDDVAGAVAWLLGDDASYVTGQTISVNGGVFLT